MQIKYLYVTAMFLSMAFGYVDGMEVETIIQQNPNPSELNISFPFTGTLQDRVNVFKGFVERCKNNIKTYKTDSSQALLDASKMLVYQSLLLGEDSPVDISDFHKEVIKKPFLRKPPIHPLALRNFKKAYELRKSSGNKAEDFLRMVEGLSDALWLGSDFPNELQDILKLFANKNGEPTSLLLIVRKTIEEAFYSNDGLLKIYKQKDAKRQRLAGTPLWGFHLFKAGFVLRVYRAEKKFLELEKYINNTFSIFTHQQVTRIKEEFFAPINEFISMKQMEQKEVEKKVKEFEEKKEEAEIKAITQSAVFAPEGVSEPLMKSESVGEVGFVKKQVIYDNRAILWSLFTKNIPGTGYCFGSKFVKIKQNSRNISDFLSLYVTLDGKTVVVGGVTTYKDDKVIKIWKLKEDGSGKYKLKQKIDKASSSVKSAIYSVSSTSDAKILVSGGGVGNDGVIKIWKLKEDYSGKYELKQKIDKTNKELGAAKVLFVAITSDAKILVSGEYEGPVKIWTLKESGKYELNQNIDAKVGCHATSVAITPNGTLLILGRFDGTLEVWKLKDDKIGEYELKQTIGKKDDGHLKGFVSSVSIASNGRIFISGSFDEKIKIWKLKEDGSGTKELQPPLKYECKQTIDVKKDDDWNVGPSVSMAFDGKAFVAMSNDRIINVWTCDDKGLFTCDIKLGLKGISRNPKAVMFNNYAVACLFSTCRFGICRLGDFLDSFEDLSFQQLLLVIRLQRDVLKGMKNIKLKGFEERFFFTLPKTIRELFSDVVKDYLILTAKWFKQLYGTEGFKALKEKRLEREEKQKEEMLKKEKFKKKMEERKQENLEELQKQIQEQEEAKIKLKLGEESPYLKDLKKKFKELTEQGFVEPEEEKHEEKPEKKSEDFMEEVD